MLTALEIKILAGVGVLIAVLVGIGLWNKHQQSVGAATVRAEQAELNLKAVQAARVEEQRRTDAIQEKANVADQQASAARADAAAARTAGDRLLQRVAAANRARDAALRAAAAGASAPAGAASAVPVDDVLSRVVDAARQLGTYADELKIHLDACIGSYESLTHASP